MKKIRKISLGTNPKDSLNYVIGGVHNIGNNGKIRITDIIKEQTSSLFKRATKYYIWAERVGFEGNYFLWYEIDSVPIVVQYDIDNEL